MAQVGRLGAADLSATTNTYLYTCPARTSATVNVTICERAGATPDVRIALVDATSGAPANEDYLVYDYPMSANESYERTAIVVGAQQSIVVYSSAANVTAICWGFEE